MFFFSLPALAQKKLTEGSIFYDVTISNNGDKPQNAEFLDGATNAIYVKGGKVRTEMVSPVGTQTTVINQAENKKEITILKEYGEQKNMINLSPAEGSDLHKK